VTAPWKVPDYFGAVIPLGHSGLPLDAQAWQVFENFVHSLGLTEIGNISYFAVVQAWRPGVTPPATVPPFTQPPTAAHHNFAPRINQKVIDLFRAVFGSDFWSVVIRAGLAHVAASPAARQAAYTGPDVEDLPLTEDEQAALIAAL
jgi:hypothetical protein